MVRPEIDEDVIEMLNEIIDDAVEVPLNSDELSINKQVRIVVQAQYKYLEADNNMIDQTAHLKEPEI